MNKNEHCLFYMFCGNMSSVMSRHKATNKGIVPIDFDRKLDLTSSPITRDAALISLRRREVLRLRVEEGLPLFQIAERILENRHLYLKTNANYAESNVRSDLYAAARDIVVDRNERAEVYITNEIERLESLEEKNMKLIDKAIRMADKLEEDDVRGMKNIMDSVTKATGTIVNIMHRRSKYLGLDKPKEHNVNSTNTNISINLDDFLTSRKQFIEGEASIVVEDDTGN